MRHLHRMVSNRLLGADLHSRCRRPQSVKQGEGEDGGENQVSACDQQAGASRTMRMFRKTGSWPRILSIFDTLGNYLLQRTPLLRHPYWRYGICCDHCSPRAA